MSICPLNKLEEGLRNSKELARVLWLSSSGPKSGFLLFCFFSFVVNPSEEIIRFVI